MHKLFKATPISHLTKLNLILFLPFAQILKSALRDRFLKNEIFVRYFEEFEECSSTDTYYSPPKNRERRRRNFVKIPNRFRSARIFLPREKESKSVVGTTHRFPIEKRRRRRRRRRRASCPTD